MLRQKMNAGHKQQPGSVPPTRQEPANARPSIYAGRDSALRVYGLHPAQRFALIHLREAPRHTLVVHIHKLDFPGAVVWSHAVHTCAAQPTRTVIKYRQFRHAILPVATRRGLSQA